MKLPTSSLNGELAPLGADEVVGALNLKPDGSLEGWCWSPGRADERLTVEILDGEALALSVVANIYRRDLADAGIGDGRHGFTARLPDHPTASGGRLVRARERGSLEVFGAVRDETGGHERTGIERLDRATAELAALQNDITALRDRMAAQRERGRPARALHDLAVMLATRSRLSPTADPRGAEFAVVATAEDLRRRFAPLTLPAGVTAPQASLIVLTAPDIADTMACLRGLAALPWPGPIEIVLADDGREPRHALIQTLVHNLRVAHASGSAASPALRASRAVTEAAALARGRHLVMLSAQAKPPSVAALATLLRTLDSHPEHVMPGAAGRASLARWGLTAPDSSARQGDDEAELIVRLGGAIGLIVAMPLSRWVEIGGFDPQLADGAGLECADLALKAWLLGCPIGRAVERLESGESPASSWPGTSPQAAWQAASLFRARWGNLGLDQEIAP